MPMPEPGRTLLICCGAIAREIVALVGDALGADGCGDHGDAPGHGLENLDLDASALRERRGEAQLVQVDLIALGLAARRHVGGGQLVFGVAGEGRCSDWSWPLLLGSPVRDQIRSRRRVGP